MALDLQPNFHEPRKSYARALESSDASYGSLVELHRGLTDEQSAMVSAKLILLLANHIGNLSILRDAMRIARADAWAHDWDNPCVVVQAHFADRQASEPGPYA